jgi:hypothetical protein
MWRRLLRFDGTFSTVARVAAAALVTAGFAVGYVARPTHGDGGADAAAPIAKSRIEADLLPPRADRGAVLTGVAGLPRLGRTARPPRRVHRAAPAESAATPEPTATAEPVAAPLATPSPAPAPVATAAPPPRTPPAPEPTPAGETFDSSG